MIAICLLIIFSNINSKQKILKLKQEKLCLGGFSNDSSLSDFTAISKIYHFSVDYQLATTDKIQKIHKYLTKKHSI